MDFEFRRVPTETPVMIEHNGKVYQGSYRIGKETITVSYGTHDLIAKLDRIPAATLAKMMLREIVAGRPKATAELSLPRWNHDRRP